MKMARTKGSAKKMIRDRKSRTMKEFYSPVPKDNDGSPGSSNAMGSTAKMPTASSRSVFEDIGNKPRGAQIARGTSKINDPESEKDKEIEIKFISDTLKGEHVARGGANESLFTALKTVDVLKDLWEKNRKKELHLVDLHGKSSFNLGMPLKCLGEDTTFEIRFYPFGSVHADDPNERTDKYRSYDAGDKEIITFYVKAKSNRKILFSNSLPKHVHSVCVFAVEGESFRDALCKDGRFLPALKDAKWKLVEGNDFLSSKFRVDNYSKRTFSVEFTSNKKRSTPGQTSELSASPVQKNQKSFSKSLLEQYPCLEEQGTLIQEVLRAEAEKRNVPLKTLLKLQKSEFGKVTVNSTVARVLKMLACRLDRVGYIYWDNQGTKGCGTCFLLAGSYILTCHHVIRDIVGKGVEERHWPAIISSSARVTFSYEGHLPPQKNFYRIEAWFDVSDTNLDYALLKLQGNWDTFPRGLISLVSQQPCNGLVYIIGHPEGDEKTIDACTVIPFMDRHTKIISRLHGEQILHLFSPPSFDDSLKPKALTYDTSFFNGSSGAPVFDFSGQLVAMHTAGHLYKVNRQTRSVIEFGWLMKEICSDIERKDKALYDHLLREDSKKNKDMFVSSHCSDVTMDGEETAEDCASGEAMDIEG